MENLEILTIGFVVGFLVGLLICALYAAYAFSDSKRDNRRLILLTSKILGIIGIIILLFVGVLFWYNVVLNAAFSQDARPPIIAEQRTPRIIVPGEPLPVRDLDALDERSRQQRLTTVTAERETRQTIVEAENPDRDVVDKRSAEDSRRP